ncbi:MAG: hypothetical protein R3C68_07495 [Myxococcota bacterium]
MLAKLDLKRVEQVLQAEKSGIVKSHTTKVDVDDIFDKHAKKAAPPPPPFGSRRRFVGCSGAGAVLCHGHR